MLLEFSDNNFQVADLIRLVNPVADDTNDEIDSGHGVDYIFWAGLE